MERLFQHLPDEHANPIDLKSLPKKVKGALEEIPPKERELIEHHFSRGEVGRDQVPAILAEANLYSERVAGKRHFSARQVCNALDKGEYDIYSEDSIRKWRKEAGYRAAYRGVAVLRLLDHLAKAPS